MSAVKISSVHNGPPVEPHYEDRYMHIFEFEKYDHTKWHDWMHHHWDVSLYASGIYVFLIFVGQYLMKNRQPFEVRNYLLLWNVLLATFSAVGFCRSIPELWYEWTKSPIGGLQRSVCFADNHNIATSLWGLLFAWSKLVEFGDTAFIILKKQPLIFLHWYHHVTVTIYCWFAYSAYDPSSRWFCTMNYFVHSLMYTYYALKITELTNSTWSGQAVALKLNLFSILFIKIMFSRFETIWTISGILFPFPFGSLHLCSVLQIKIPKNIPMMITILQIMQMVMGVIINVNTYYTKRGILIPLEKCVKLKKSCNFMVSGAECKRPYSNIHLAFAMYTTYFILFANFFRKAYFSKRRQNKDKTS